MMQNGRENGKNTRLGLQVRAPAIVSQQAELTAVDMPVLDEARPQQKEVC